MYGGKKGFKGVKKKKSIYFKRLKRFTIYKKVENYSKVVLLFVVKVIKGLVS